MWAGLFVIVSLARVCGLVPLESAGRVVVPVSD